MSTRFPHWHGWLLEFIVWLALFGAGTVLVVSELAADRDAQRFTEHSLVEIAQFGLLLGSLALLSIGSRRDCLWLNGWLALFLAMIWREADFVLDRHIVDGAWQLAVTATAVAFLAWMLRRRPGFTTDPTVVAGASGYYVSGLAVLAAAQGIGYKWIWIQILGPDFERDAKNFAEEVTELLGFVLLFMGSFRYRVLRHMATRPDPAS